MAELRTTEDIRSFLKYQDRKYVILLAARAAARALPFVTHFKPPNERAEKLALLTMRCILTSGVAAYSPTPEVSEAATRAARAAGAAGVTAFAVDAAGAAANAANATFAADATGFAIDAAGAAADAARAAFAADAKALDADLFKKPLWPGGRQPDAIASALSVHPDLLDSGPVWPFWQRWGNGMLSGQPIDWHLQEKVALIPDDNWKQGLEHIADVIRGIEAEYLAEKAPLAETVEFNEETAKFYIVPTQLKNSALFTAMMKRTEDCIKDALLGANGLRENSSEVRKLRRTHDYYTNDPQQIELTYTSVTVSLRRQIHESGELAKSEDNFAVLEAVEEGALAIRANHADVAENRKTIAKQKLREMEQDGIDLLEDAKPVLAAISQDLMHEDFEIDIPQLINDATLPLPSGAPPLPGVDESMRIFSRISKMKLAYDAMTKNGADIFDSKGFKTTRLGLTVGGVLSALVTLGLRLFGAL